MMTRGFTLVEVLIALVLLEFGVLGAVGVMTLAGKTLTRAEEVERAVTAVEGVADSLRAMGRLAVAGQRVVPGVGVVEWRPRGVTFEIVVTSGPDTLLSAVAPGRPGS